MIFLLGTEQFWTVLSSEDRRIRRKLALKGSGSFQAWYYIGISHQELSDDENAKSAWHKCLELYPEHIFALEALKKLKNPSI